MTDEASRGSAQEKELVANGPQRKGRICVSERLCSPETEFY